MDIKDKLNTSLPEVIEFVRGQYASHCSIYGLPTFPVWRKREAVRVKTGFYQTSEVIDVMEVKTGYNHALHISHNDPTMVAYTPSVEAGNEDKQLTTTLGKFLRKHMLLVTDTWIAEQVTAHMAEVNGTFECARTAAEIRWAYTSMPSDGSCMRYQPSQWYGDKLDVHPSEVYATEHTYVAYIPGEPDDEERPTVKARAVVYEKGDDKRYVRVYGAPVLEKILQRKGFKCGTLVGAMLRRIPIPETTNSYVMPYLDGPGGAQSDQNCYVVDDGTELIVMHSDKASRFGTGFYARAKNNGGARVTLQPIPDATWVSDMTGITYDTLTDVRPVYYMGPLGTVCKASDQEIYNKRVHEQMRSLKTRHNGATIQVCTYYNAPKFYGNGVHWLDNDTNRQFSGHARVTSKYDILYVGMWAERVGPAIDHNGKDITVSNETPLVTVVGSDGVMRGMPKVCVALLPNRKDYRKCGRYNERDVYAYKTNPKLIQSEGGTWFIEGVHDGYGQCAISGKWYATKALTTVARWGQEFTVAKDQTGLTAKLLPLVTTIQEWKAIVHADDLSEGTLEVLLRGADKRAAHLVYHEAGLKEMRIGTGGELVRDYYRRDVTMTQVIENLAAVNARCTTGVWGETDRAAVEAFNAIVETDRAAVEEFNAIVDMVRAHYDPYEAMLKATIARLDAEEAGQTVITEGETV